MSGLSGRRIGRYQVLEQVARGGMAAVYRAHDPAHDRFVALKVVAPHLSDDPNFEARFRREAEFLLRLKHPHIIPVEDFGEAEGYAYLVMPFLEVGTLTDWLHDIPVSLRHGARLIGQLSDALQYAHDQGIVHRDVKPSNILLDDQGNALLSDFGLARPEEGDASLTGSMFVGTPAFMSPEQVKGGKANTLSDQYSLGVILYLLTMGRLPFQGETPMATALKHLNEPLPEVRSAKPSVPEAVEYVIRRATAKEPHDRFASVAEMNQAFQEAVAHVLDPASNPAPSIPLPESVQPTVAIHEVSRAGGYTFMRMAGAATLALLLVLVYPVLASGRMSVRELLSPASGGTPAIAAGLGADDGHPGGLSGTIEAMSTELAGSRAELMEAEQVQTAVMETLVASGWAGTPTPESISTATPVPTDALRYFLTPISLVTPTRTPTSTGPPPSLTPPSSPTVEASATSTTVPSPTLVPSDTPLPPTNTPAPSPTVDVCTLVSHGSLQVDANKVSLEISNGGSTAITISQIVLDWPAPNVDLRKIRLAGSLIWNGVDSVPPTDIVPDKGNRTIPAGAPPKDLLFEFGATAAASGYDLLVEFDNGCQIDVDG